MALQALVACVLFRFTSTQNSNHYLAVMEDKIDRLESLTGERLVILGGSNTVFGMHSDVIEAATHYSVVNLGLHVSLGLEFPMRCYLPHARAGDIVVLCPEYHVMMDESQQIGDPIVTNQLTEQWPSAKKYLPRETPESLKQFLDHDGLLLAHQWVSRSIKMIRGRDRQSDKLYRRSSFNEYGDLVGHYKIKSGELTAFGGIPTPEEALLEQTASIINRFANQCKEKGVEVYFSFPPFAESAFEDSQSAISLTETYLREKCKIVYLNRPTDNIYSDHCFHDSVYHLNGPTGLTQSTRLAKSIMVHR